MKTSTPILILARSTSTRLPGKHFIKVKDKPLLNHLISRIERHVDSDVYIACPDDPSSDLFEEVGAQTLRGSKENIPLRIAQVLEQLSCNQAIVIDGDDVAVSCSAINALHAMADLISGWASTSGLPLGMNAMLIRKDQLSQPDIRSARRIETDWTRYFATDEKTCFSMPTNPSWSQLRFTVDYQEDIDFFVELFNHLPPFDTCSDLEIIETALNKELWTINSKVTERYWENFRLQTQGELQ